MSANNTFLYSTDEDPSFAIINLRGVSKRKPKIV